MGHRACGLTHGSMGGGQLYSLPSALKYVSSIDLSNVPVRWLGQETLSLYGLAFAV